jgi:F-box domain
MDHSFPAEIYIHILSKLDHFDLFNSRLVSKSFYEYFIYIYNKAINDLLKDYNFHITPDTSYPDIKYLYKKITDDLLVNSTFRLNIPTFFDDSLHFINTLIKISLPVNVYVDKCRVGDIRYFIQSHVKSIKIVNSTVTIKEEKHLGIFSFVGCKVYMDFVMMNDMTINEIFCGCELFPYASGGCNTPKSQRLGGGINTGVDIYT